MRSPGPTVLQALLRVFSTLISFELIQSMANFGSSWLGGKAIVPVAIRGCVDARTSSYPCLAQPLFLTCSFSYPANALYFSINVSKGSMQIESASTKTPPYLWRISSGEYQLFHSIHHRIYAVFKFGSKSAFNKFLFIPKIFKS